MTIDPIQNRNAQKEKKKEMENRTNRTDLNIFNHTTERHRSIPRNSASRKYTQRDIEPFALFKLCAEMEKLH